MLLIAENDVRMVFEYCEVAEMMFVLAAPCEYVYVLALFFFFIQIGTTIWVSPLSKNCLACLLIYLVI